MRARLGLQCWSASRRLVQLWPTIASLAAFFSSRHAYHTLNAFIIPVNQAPSAHLSGVSRPAHVTRHGSLLRTATVATARLASLEPCPPTYLASLLRLLQPLTLFSRPPPHPRRLTFAHRSNQPQESRQTTAYGLAGKPETKLDAAIQILHTSRELGFRQEACVPVVVLVKHLGYFIVCLDVHEPVFACRLVRAKLQSQDMMFCRAGRAETSVQGSKTCRSSPSRCILPEIHSPSNLCTSFVAICMTHFT